MKVKDLIKLYYILTYYFKNDTLSIVKNNGKYLIIYNNKNKSYLKIKKNNHKMWRF